MTWYRYDGMSSLGYMPMVVSGLCIPLQVMLDLSVSNMPGARAGLNPSEFLKCLSADSSYARGYTQIAECWEA